MEGKLVEDGAYTMDIFVKTEDGVLIETPIPFAFPDTTSNIEEGNGHICKNGGWRAHRNTDPICLP
jgi:hypothetical protein